MKPPPVGPPDSAVFRGQTFTFTERDQVVKVNGPWPENDGRGSFRRGRAATMPPSNMTRAQRTCSGASSEVL